MTVYMFIIPKIQFQNAALRKVGNASFYSAVTHVYTMYLL